MIRPVFPLFASALALGACATVPGEGPTEDRDPTMDGACNAQSAQRFIGQAATAEVGGAILAATGARTLRWGPPDAVFTMDFRQDRVNVMYDNQRRITEIRCG